MIIDCLNLFITFVKLGFLSFGGGYAMLSMIMSEAQRFSVTPAQFADLNALDMVVPGSISINAATYVGYLARGIPGAVSATIGVSLPSFILTVLIMRFFVHFKENFWVDATLSGIKPAAVGLIAAAAVQIGAEVLLAEGKRITDVFTDPFGTFSVICIIIFVLTAVLNIRFKINPILLTILAGVVGAFVLA
ncbi:chromate transporter [Muricomes intestini]|uniref:chromate transporter n=1 Tax=Muricomes intestini TaxID=1796634 RepID=UPI002FE2D516